MHLSVFIYASFLFHSSSSSAFPKDHSSRSFGSALLTASTRPNGRNSFTPFSASYSCSSFLWPSSSWHIRWPFRNCDVRLCACNDWYRDIFTCKFISIFQRVKNRSLHPNNLCTCLKRSQLDREGCGKQRNVPCKCRCSSSAGFFSVGCLITRFTSVCSSVWHLKR